MRIDPQKDQRVVPMEVFSLGMLRTGTASMQLALSILGYPCYHGFTLIANIRDTELWNKALDAKFYGKEDLFSRANWDQLLGNYSAVSDLSPIAFAEDLLHCYPDAKVVLVERDVEKWSQSFNDGVIMGAWSPVLRLIARLDSRFVGKLAGTSARWTEGWMDAHSRQEMQKKAREKYRQHYTLVERVTPSQQLLIFKLEDGWKPLCEFLGRPIADLPFPRVNESTALKEKIGLIARRGFMNALISSINIVLPVAILLLTSALEFIVAK